MEHFVKEMMSYLTIEKFPMVISLILIWKLDSTMAKIHKTLETMIVNVSNACASVNDLKDRIYSLREFIYLWVNEKKEKQEVKINAKV